MKKLLVGVAVLFLAAIPVSAAVVRGGDTYTLPKGQTVHDNLYVAGKDLALSGVVVGDVIAAGGSITLGGGIRDDLAAAGGSIQVLSSVGGDARIVGGDVIIEGTIGGDLIVAGGTIHVLQSSVISGDVIMAGGTLTFDGVALKSMRIFGGSAVIRGIVSGSVEAKVSESITVATGASIKGNFDYTAPAMATIEQGAIIGGKITASTTPTTGNGNVGAILATLISVALLTKFIVLAIAAALLVHFFRNGSSAVVTRSLSEIPKNTILGFAALIVVPVAAILLLATILFSPFGILGLILYVFLLALAKLYVGIVVGAQVSKWFVKETRITVGYAVLGVAIIELVSLVPIFGWIVVAIAFLATFGALTRLLNDRYWLNR